MNTDKAGDDSTPVRHALTLTQYASSTAVNVHTKHNSMQTNWIFIKLKSKSRSITDSTCKPVLMTCSFQCQNCYRPQHCQAILVSKLPSFPQFLMAVACCSGLQQLKFKFQEFTQHMTISVRFPIFSWFPLFFFSFFFFLSFFPKNFHVLKFHLFLLFFSSYFTFLPQFHIVFPNFVNFPLSCEMSFHTPVWQTGLDTSWYT